MKVLRVDDAIHEAIAKAAKAEGRTIQGWVDIALSEALSHPQVNIEPSDMEPKIVSFEEPQDLGKVVRDLDPEPRVEPLE